MKERGILFSGPMIRALLDGRKTQTRRIMKLQPPSDYSTLHVGPYHPPVIRRGEYEPGPETFGAFTVDGEWALPCPYGAPGDRLYVREAFFDHGPFDAAHPELTKRDERIEYREDKWDRAGGDAGGGWKPSIHMPRWASRISLEIAEVRVGRVQAISEADAQAEGVECRHCDGNNWRGFGWDANPFVWALTFTVVTP